ncbi:MAG: 23S rRNA (uracil(1939)-C(5))-methyltransferase RlmD [Lachnospiraceae bacterium]|nr:23S rRNA (uracil(1939)-C(5))-methyltransferase RlmD [Lachnospiraceae bacterium]MBQ7247166.1 23S rRNA (uracil(1939)-C(5))-methyltransferase RlmD [Lachnospiraceae bacterium]
MLNKNDVITMTFTDMTENGEGIGHHEGYPLFVKDAVIGDTARVLVTKPGKTYGFGRVQELITPSPDRAIPRCPIAAPCGGCQLQALSYPAQLAFKENKVRQHLIRLGGIAEPLMEPILGMEDPWHYRNKAQIPFGTDKNGQVTAGYYAARSHRIVPMTDCLLNLPGFDRILQIILDHARARRLPAYDEETGRGLLRHALIRRAAGSGEWMVCLVLNGRKLPGAQDLVSALREIPGMTDISLNVNTRRDNVILSDELIPLYGSGYITESIGDLKFRLSPLAFFQVNPKQTEVLYAKALEFADLTGTENVWDLYCGTGTISLFLARRAARVRGVEIIAPAIENARANAALNGITNAEFFVGRSEEIFPAWCREHPAETPDVVVLDPPRKGCDTALLQALISCSPARIVYVSCNSATLARDLKILREEGGYELRKVQPVDMFPQGVHVETVCALSKLSEAKHHISIQVDMDELDLTSAESKATYEEIQEWVQEKYGFHVTHLNIAQVKRKYGIIERENYNKPKSKDSRQPGCPEEKVIAIEEALKHFQMI